VVSASLMPEHTQITSSAAARLLLSPDARITCPHCDHEFALADGFARKALESVEEASAHALAALREHERLSIERQARKFAQESDAAHAKALAEVRSLTALAFTPQLDALKAQLADERQGFAQRLAEQSERVQSLQSEQLALREERQRLLDAKQELVLEVQRQVDARVAEREVLIRSQEQQ
jgi:phage terminase large subunit GpA-like protein